MKELLIRFIIAEASCIAMSIVPIIITYRLKGSKGALKIFRETQTLLLIMMYIVEVGRVIIQLLNK